MRSVFVFVCVALAALVTALPVSVGDSYHVAVRSDMPSFVINLDLPAEQRWVEIALHFKAEIQNATAFIGRVIPEKYTAAAIALAGMLDSHMGEFGQEIKGMANALDMKVGELVLLNLMYELAAHCTSIIAMDKDGILHHGRNLDYSLPEVLSPLTTHVQFQKNSTTVYHSTSFACFVGVLTGMRPRAFSITVDERDTDSAWPDLIETAFRHGQPMSWEVRRTLEEEHTALAAIERLTTAHLITPVYFIVAGLQDADGAVITRWRDKAADVWTLDPESRWFEVETNYDHWVAPPERDDRRTPANKLMNELGQARVSTESIETVLATPPVFNHHSIYTTLMCAATGEFVTYLVQ